MDKSNEFFVNPKGRLIRSIYDSHAREEFEIDVYGVHRTTFNVWIWNPTKGPARSITDSWLKSEDGVDFQKFMDEMETFGLPDAPPWEPGDDDEINLNLNELPGPPDDEE